MKKYICNRNNNIKLHDYYYFLGSNILSDNEDIADFVDKYDYDLDDIIENKSKEIRNHLVGPKAGVSKTSRQVKVSSYKIQDKWRSKKK